MFGYSVFPKLFSTPCIVTERKFRSFIPHLFLYSPKKTFFLTYRHQTVNSPQNISAPTQLSNGFSIASSSLIAPNKHVSEFDTKSGNLTK